MTTESLTTTNEKNRDTIQVPAPTAWPLVLAFGVCLLFAGLATNAYISVLGAGAMLLGAIGWFRNVFPHEAHEAVPTLGRIPAVTTQRREVAQLDVAARVSRAWLPLHIYPISSGIKGGLAGGAAMAVLAMLYGVVSHHGIWYPVNLLSAGFFPSMAAADASDLGQFSLSSFLIAAAIHLIASIVVGLLYGAMLPLVPRRPILLGGVLAPLLWTGLLHSSLSIINPVLNQHVDWFWFVLSQVAFGVVAGIVVSRHEQVRTLQGFPLALRFGIESPGIEESREKEPRQ